MNTIKASLKTKIGDLDLDLSFEIPGSGVTALYGRSGSGKTTILRFLAGLGKRYSGDLSVTGKIWEDSKKRIFIPTHKRAIGYVFQDSDLFPHLNVHNNLLYGYNRIPAQEKIDLNNTIDLLGIRKLLQRIPSELSGGEKQRVAIARSLLSNPKILLLDEPLSNLDITSKLEILPYLEKIRAETKIPLIYVSHSTEEINRLADYIIQIDNGKILTSGIAETVLLELKDFNSQKNKVFPIIISISGESALERNLFIESVISILKTRGHKVGKIREELNQLNINENMFLLETNSPQTINDLMINYFENFDIVLSEGKCANASAQLSLKEFKQPEKMATLIQSHYLSPKY